MINERRLPKYTQKEVLAKLCISQSTLYRIRKEHNLLTKKVKRRYTEEEIEELGEIIIEQYK
jgi:predicted DNA-binding transcriptional regulator AlpA